MEATPTLVLTRITSVRQISKITLVEDLNSEMISRYFRWSLFACGHDRLIRPQLFITNMEVNCVNNFLAIVSNCRWYRHKNRYHKAARLQSAIRGFNLMNFNSKSRVMRPERKFQLLANEFVAFTLIESADRPSGRICTNSEL